MPGWRPSLPERWCRQAGEVDGGCHGNRRAECLKHDIKAAFMLLIMGNLFFTADPSPPGPPFGVPVPDSGPRRDATISSDAWAPRRRE